VVTKNGDVYERRLIEKHIATTGLDPVTKQPLALEELIPLKTMPNPAAIRPKTAAQQGIPAMLQQFTSEWDSMMLEIFTLKQQLTVAQQQLSNALYQQDAACRVIARLVKERDQYKRELGSGRATSSNENGMDVDGEVLSVTSVLPSQITKRIEAKLAELSQMRQNRKIPASVATRDKVATYQSVLHQAPHKTGAVNCMDVVGDLLITGGVDKSVVLTDRASGEKLGSLTGNKKPITSIRAIKIGSEVRIVAGNDDGVLMSWVGVASNVKEFKLATTIQASDSGVRSIDIHPIGDVALVGLKNGSFAIVDLSNGSVYAHTHAKLASPITAVQFHPDGEILATASEDGAIQIWNVSTFAHLASFVGHTASIVGIQFSENGYTLASTSADQTLKLWDLENIGQCHTAQLSAQPTALAYDFSGRFLAVAVTYGAKNATKELRIFTGKNLDLVSTFESSTKGDISAIRWGMDAQWLSFAQERNFHVYSS
jgi:pre-mRNA-processing factor 19